MFANPDVETIRQMLQQIHTVAVVGLSPDDRCLWRDAHELL